jgi:HEAT repeat protein
VKSGDHTLPGRLAALFRERPEAAVDAVALLRKSGPHKAITDGLGAASSPAALAALGSLTLDRALPTAVRVDALTALVLVQHPTPEGMRIPVALVEDGDKEIRSVARLISGAVARTGRTQNQAEAEAIDKVLIERYRKAREVTELSDLVAALGNSGGPEALPVIEEALGDARPTLRAAAVRALRLAPGAEIDRLLSAAITSDPEPSVRSDAIFAVGFRRPLGSQLGEALLRAVKSDPADYVRSSAITLLRRNPDASTRLAETLAWVAENDAQAGNRRLAREALASLSGSGMR